MKFCSGIIMKHILLIGTALTLSACGWNGSRYEQSHSYSGHGGYYSHGGGYYGHSGHQPRNIHGQHQVNSTTALEMSGGVEMFTGGDILRTIPRPDGAIQSIDAKDAYDTAWRASAGISHDVAPRTTLLARGFYKTASASDDNLTVFNGNGGATNTASLTDYNSYGAEVGFREYLNHAGNNVRPYAGATVGAAYVEDISFTNLINNGTPLAGEVSMSDGQWIPTASAVVGLELPVSRSFSMGLETGLRYEGKLDQNLDNLIESDSQDLYSVPVQLRGRFRF